MRHKRSRKSFSEKTTARFRALPRWARFSLLLAGAMSFLTTAGGISLFANYSSKANALDITALDRIQKGAEVLDSKGDEIGRIMIKDRRVLEFHEIPENVVSAVVATEDSRFYSHGGVDLRGIARSAATNAMAMGIEQGASTITQQLARHVYKLRGRNFDRKLTEMFAARRMEREYSKNEILTHYLNNIYMGSGFYGMGSAAEGYFGKEIGELKVHEAAMLAGIIKSPSGYSPFVSPKNALRVRNLSLGRMLDLGMVTKPEHDSAVAEPLGTVEEYEQDSRPFFALQAVRREVDRRTDSRDDLDEGRIFTTLDNELTDATTAAIQRNLHTYERTLPPAETKAGEDGSRLEAAALVIDNRTGRILSAVGGRDYRENAFDYAFKGRRTPGTAILPLTYAAYFSGNDARMRGYVLDAPIDNEKVMVGGTKGMLGEWGTLNDEFEGEIPAALALYQTKTGAAVRAGYEVGVDRFVEVARQFGIASPVRGYPASFVGASQITLLELVRAYTVFANGGILCPEPRLVDGVFASDGGRVRLINRIPANEMRAVSREVADFTRSILVSRMQGPDMDSILHNFGLGDKGLAGQHGSSHGGKDAWFVGFDRNITCAVWIGRIDESPLRIDNPGYNLAMPVWAEIMEAATGGRPSGFDLARGLNGQSICLKSGDIASASCIRDANSGVIPAEAIPKGIRSAAKCSAHGEGKASPPRAKAVVVGMPSGYAPAYVKPREEFLAEGDPYGGN